MFVRTKDHPEANGRKPLIGESQWRFVFPLEDGTQLTVAVGRTCVENFRKMLEQMDIDDVAEGIFDKGERYNPDLPRNDKR